MNGWITQLRKGLLEFCVLNVLRHGESYGYEIVQALKGIEELSVSESTVYPILSRLRVVGFACVTALAPSLLCGKVGIVTHRIRRNPAQETDFALFRIFLINLNIKNINIGKNLE